MALRDYLCSFPTFCSDFFDSLVQELAITGHTGVGRLSHILTYIYNIYMGILGILLFPDSDPLVHGILWNLQCEKHWKAVPRRLSWPALHLWRSEGIPGTSPFGLLCASTNAESWSTGSTGCSQAGLELTCDLVPGILMNTDEYWNIWNCLWTLDQIWFDKTPWA